MKHKSIAFALTATLLAFCTIDVFARSTSHTPHVSAQNASWSPQPYINGSSLPPNFRGLDIKQVWRLLKSKQQVLQKGEYETTAEYEQRLATSASNIGPLVLGDEYAFLLQDLKPTYDADTQTFTARKMFWCQKTLDYGQSKGWFTCAVGKISRQQSSYVGSNAYGVEASIDKINGEDFGIAVSEENKFFDSDIFSHDSFSQNNPMRELKASYAVPIDQAREVRNQTVGVLLVGKFDSARLIEGRPTLLSPTIDAPYDEFITQDAVPFTPTKLVLYVEETGKVLGVKEL